MGDDRDLPAKRPAFLAGEPGCDEQLRSGAEAALRLLERLTEQEQGDEGCRAACPRRRHACGRWGATPRPAAVRFRSGAAGAHRRPGSPRRRIQREGPGHPAELSPAARADRPRPPPNNAQPRGSQAEPRARIGRCSATSSRASPPANGSSPRRCRASARSRSVLDRHWLARRDRRRAGVSHFIEHLLFKGTRSHSAQEIAEIFDGLGGELNAATSRETTLIYARVPDDRLEPALDVMVGMVYAPAFADSTPSARSCSRRSRWSTTTRRTSCTT